jgi:hypothetical protein
MLCRWCFDAVLVTMPKETKKATSIAKQMAFVTDLMWPKK